MSVPLTANPVKADGAAPVVSLEKLREAVSESKRTALTLHLEGVVRAFNRRKGLLVLDDGKSADVLELPSLPDNLREGDLVVIRATDCLMGRGSLAIQAGTVPVVDTDGNHVPWSRSGKIHLSGGRHPFRVKWFNGYADASLGLEYEGPDIPRQKFPASGFSHRDTENGELKKGVAYASYIGQGLLSVSDLSILTPQGRGVVDDLDVSVRPAAEMAGLIFTGFIDIPKAGLYTFHLTSDDGASLAVGNLPVSCEILSNEGNVSAEKPSTTPMTAGTVDQWISFEGTVTYAAKVGSRVELDIAEGPQSIRISVADGEGLNPAALLHRGIRIEGLKKESGIVSLDATQVQLSDDPPGHEQVLTKALQIRQLQPDDPVTSHRAIIHGVVTMASPRSLVLQDATGGVFVHYFSEMAENSPQPGEIWKIEGRTGQGDFSPVLHWEKATYVGSSALPNAVQPTQQQFASGSMDAELVEIEGVVMEVSDYGVKMLTRSASVVILDNPFYPLPAARLLPAERTLLVGSVIRIRGVYRAIWDSNTGAVQPLRLMLGNATMSVDVLASGDPFSAPLIRPSELLLFTSHPSALKRVRVRGQLLHAKLSELYLFDGSKGFRAVTRQPLHLIPGEQLEISGFPQLGGPSPVLLEAVVRKIGNMALPAAIPLPAGKLPDPHLDSTIIQLEATLLSDTVRLDERALEMRAGSNRFVAYVPAGDAVAKGIERDSILRLTGVYVSATSDRALSNKDSFELYLPGPESIVVIKRGPWWTTRHTIAVITVLSAGLVLAFAWAALLRRTVARRSNELATEIEGRELIERHRAMEQERSRMAKDLHDELGSGLTEAGMLSALMRNPAIPAEKKDDYLEQLNELCCTLVTGLDEIVWAVNPRYDSAADLAGYFSLFAQRFLKLAGIDCRLKIDDAITAHPMESRLRHEIFLAFKEALNNVVKHSGARQVYLTVSVVENVLVISVSDDGCGFDPSGDISWNDGLRNITERIEALGGLCQIDTNPGGGTSVQFEIPIQENHS